MAHNFEIGIIGGGPAGSTAATYLAEYGFNVCLFEKKDFPRETLCGEFLSSEVIHLLKDQNLFDEFISLNPNKISSFRFFNTSGRCVASKFDFEAFGLSRSLFDNILLCNAQRKGITVFQPAEIKEMIPLQSGFKLIFNSDKEEKIVYVNDLIGAYGKQNPIDNYLNRNFIRKQSKLNGIKFHLKKNELSEFVKNEIQIYSADNIYCGVNAVDNNKVTFCFLEDRNTEQPPPRKQLIELREKNKAFKKFFIKESENVFNNIPVYGTGNIYFGKRNLVEKGIFMIGDAAGVIAPLSGDGIGIAMESGKLIADIFKKKRRGGLTEKRTEYLYKKEWNKLFFKRMKTAKTIQKVILSKFGRELGFGLIKLFPSLLPYLIKSTRNTFQKKI